MIIHSNQTFEHHSFPILLNGITIGVLHTICLTNTPEVSQLSTQQERILKAVASILGPFINVLFCVAYFLQFSIDG